MATVSTQGGERARLHAEANQQPRSVTRQGLSNRDRVHNAAAAHEDAYTDNDFTEQWAQKSAFPTSFVTEMVRLTRAERYYLGDELQLIAVALVAMSNRFRYPQLSAPCSDGEAGEPDDEPCIKTLARIYYRANYAKEVCSI